MNVTAVILESVPGLTDPYQAWFDAFEIFSVIVSSIEYLLRVWSCVAAGQATPRQPVLARAPYMLTPMALIDLIAIMPLYLSFFGPLDLRFMRVLRPLRLFKLTRYSASMSLLLQVLREGARSICAALFILTLLLVLTASLAYLAEHSAQPDTFGSIPEAMWWAVITMTTVGYGDVTPVTTGGKVIGALIGIMGIGMVALPAGLLASGFTEHLHSRARNCRQQVTATQHHGYGGAPGEASPNLEQTCAMLDLSEEQASRILRSRAGDKENRTCRHCGGTMHKALTQTPESG